jgi:hypothetical protein
MAVDPVRAKSLFLEASDLASPTERAAYLDREYGTDAKLRARVEALLAAHDAADRDRRCDAVGIPESVADATQEVTSRSTSDTRPSTGMVTGEHRPDAPADTFAEIPPADRAEGAVVGRVIAGRYTLREVLGEGGMGTVYRADQTEPVKRQVALKLIKVGMDSRAVLARFDAERQALALMDHPNIARVYDGGTTAAGQPFFVMELVRGEPITAYCDRQRLPLRARLELFVAACQAVQHAHQKGIIHRDLKPSNVLVTEVDGRPTPKVIDFGVAKATEFKLTDQSLADTGAIVGTPAYMSPEQADPSSMDIDTRTDIYALGVILYELLAGSPPIDAKQFKRGAVLEMLRMVREVDPPRPSTKVSTAEELPNIAASRGIEPEQLKRALKGDLDWIVMKALEKDRTRRYETANGFAADVLRHLASEPVLAAPPSRAYRVRKFVRKHRGAVVAVSLVVLALLVGIAGTTLGLIRAELARAAEAQRVTEWDAAVKVAEARADELKYRLGVSNMVLASAAYENRDVVLAAERLDSLPPEQRGWEWRYLKRLIRGGLFTLYGHTSEVHSPAFSPDGARIVAASADQTAKVWDARTGTQLLELKGHTGAVSSAGFSPDGARIVTGSYDQMAKVWDARTGSRQLELKGHTGWVRGAGFSPDGARIVTASWDHTAKVWDARTGTPLLELTGHTGQMESAGFSPDGARIVTASEDQTARVWDARSGLLLLELKGHKNWVRGAAFSPDGARIVTESQDRTAKVWDARSGQELKGEPIPPAPRSSLISPDGRLIAHPVGNCVELIPLQPDEEELSDRRRLMQPNFRLYREAYDAATKANDAFAARFYLNLFPPPERALIRAESIVAPLFARLLFRDEVLAALQAQPAADPEVQAACRELARTWAESANAQQYNGAGWSLVRDPGQADASYQRGLRLARAACRLEPDNGMLLNTLGVAQYRCGLLAEALRSLTRSNELQLGILPGDLAFLALAQHRLGQSEKARDTLARLRQVMKDPHHAGNREAHAFLREAETIELDRVFPADPFAP